MHAVLNNTETLYKTLISLIEAIPDAIFLKDGNGRWLVTNEAAKTLFKLNSIDWVGKTDQELGRMRPEMLAVHEKCLLDDEATWDMRKLLVFDELVIDADGRAQEYEVRKVPIFNENGSRKGLVIIGRNVTGRNLAERNLRVADAAMDRQEAIVISDADNRILRINRAFTKLTGYITEDVIGKTAAILKSGRHDKAFYQEMWKALAEKKYWQGEIWDRRKNGQIYLKWLCITAVTGPDGNVHNYVGSFTDLSEHREAKEAIYRLAFYDPLTNLANRSLLHERMEMALSNMARNLHHGAVLMIDIDDFKLINDTKSHTVGDLLLIEVAQRLKSCVRDMDTVARPGGDEFVVILESLSLDINQAAKQAEALSNKILKAIDRPFSIAGEILHCTVCIGINILTEHTDSSDEVLKRADIAMFQAKSTGHNTTKFFDPDVQAFLEKRQSIASELFDALPNDQLRLYYQPQLDHLGNVFGAEVLLRWEHPSRGLVPPDEFIPFAEESGLILPIGEWVLHTACLQLKLWGKNPLMRHVLLAVNVSARQFAQVDFVEQVCKVLDVTGAKATLLKLELTESLMLNDVADTVRKMNALKLLGIHFSIDDFGTGHSSLSYLTRLPISQLKIDRSFVSNIDTNPSDAIVAKTIIGMANNLGFNVIAEGVETESQRLCLESYGCKSYQGYFYSKPVPLKMFEQFVRESMKESNLKKM